MPELAAPPPDRLGFTSQADEVTIAKLPMEGALPGWLRGSLLRTGPAQWEVGEAPVRHWFDGLAKLHRFTFDGGSVGYGSRFLRSRAFAAAQQGRLGYREFMSDPCRSAFRRVAALWDGGAELTDNGAVNVVRLGERWLALTETPMPVAFDPETLEALGVAEEPPGTTSTAHPIADSGELWGHGTHFGARSHYLIYAQRPGARRVVAKLPVRRPAYHHSFSLTPSWAILAEAPFTVDPLRLALGKGTFAGSFRWDADAPTRFLAVDRETGAPAGTWETEPFFCFHHVHAWEEGEELVVDLLAYPDAGVVEALSLGRLRAGEPIPVPELRRYRLGPGGQVRWEQLSERRLELATGDGQPGRSHRHVWGAGADSAFFDHIVALDLETGAEREWREPGTFPGEPVRVVSPDGTDAVLLTVVLEPERGSSSLVVLDAATLGERARARVPHHIPFGFHGAWAG